ncbi:STAS domain-containing protein [Paractinoplanes deccanensis]|uniref:STAS domain-containing protein n=1 Tax=Paractinoplanes deccanensis TaxID=113561 RepID=A0ABQ3YE36_9ACTN|nr:response regulator [Actinoplanes deccanensis]GID78264.1 STAS domain-containing protein [Actinoplanes deccanensis]
MKANRAGTPTGSRERPGNLTISHAADNAVVELAVHGQWTRHTAVDVYDALRKALAEQPSAIIIDLQEMSDLDGLSVPTWIAASRAAMSLQPPPVVALCAPPTRRLVTRLRQLGCARFLTLFVTVGQARAAVANALPLTDRLQLRWLPPHPDSLTAVHDAIRSADRAWTVPALVGAAQDVARDLVTDSLEHAGTAMLFTICRRRGSLYLALRDHEPTLPPLRRPGAGGGTPARLPVVNGRSCVWGASTVHDGKLVWAVVRSRPAPALSGAA